MLYSVTSLTSNKQDLWLWEDFPSPQHCRTHIKLSVKYTAVVTGDIRLYVFLLFRDPNAQENILLPLLHQSICSFYGLLSVIITENYYALPNLWLHIFVLFNQVNVMNIQPDLLVYWPIPCYRTLPNSNHFFAYFDRSLAICTHVHNTITIGIPLDCEI